MRFSHPDGGYFEIPDAWWTSAGMSAFPRVSEAYKFKPDDAHPEYPIQLVPFDQIAPFRRQASRPLDFGGFEKDRMIRILNGFVSGSAMEPVKLKQTPMEISCTHCMTALIDIMLR